MDRGKGMEEEKTNNSLVPSVVIRDNIVKLLDFLERLKNENQTGLDFRDVLENMTVNLTVILRCVHFCYLNSDDFNATICHKSYEVQSLVDANNVLIHLQRYIRIVISPQSCSESSSTVNEEHLVEHLDSLLMNLHDLSSVGLIFPLMTQYEVLQAVCTNIRDFHKLIVNGCVEHEIVEYVMPKFQLMAERVRNFCLVLSAEQLPNSVELDGELDVPPIHVRLGHLLEEIIPVELEVMDICFINLKASKSAVIGRFIDVLLKASPYILTEYLICLQDHMISVTSSSASIKEIHVMIEFLLVILTDMPTDLIYPDKLFDLLAYVRALTKELSVFIFKLENKSRKEECTDEINSVIPYLLKSIEKLKGDLKHVYMKAPSSSELCFRVSDGPLFMNLLLNNLNDLFHCNAYSVDLIKEEIGLVNRDLEFIRSFLGNVEQELNQDIWKRVLDVAYEAKDAINSILSRDNGLMHLIFSLPNARENIKLIKEEVSNLPQMIPKNADLIVVDSEKKLVGKKLLTDGKVFVGFKEERDWIIRKLTNGQADLDVISIIGMPGVGKTTLANEVYNDMSVIGHFDMRAWCTVGQEYTRITVMQKIFNQVTGLNEKFREDTDVDDVLRKKLFGRRYLIVLDDLWDTSTWDDLTRPFPLVERGSRIILTSRNREVALHVKRHSDPLNLRLLRPEESWELLEKRVFREESCPIELSNVGKQIAENCQGLPLVVDLIAGVIARREKEVSFWLELLKNFNSFIFEDEVEVMKIIQLSYDHLSDQLKLCFLYLGSYRKDEQIEVSELLNLWHAEGFVETEMMRVNEVMEDYLYNLISSSLVTVSKNLYGNTVCQIHDLVHDFCLIIATKEKLLDLIGSSAPRPPPPPPPPSSLSSDLLARQLTIHYGSHLSQSCRYIVLSDLDKEKDSSGKHLLSLKITGEGEGDHLICYLRHLRLLRVLNLDSNFVTAPDYLLNEIGMLVHLRFLKIRMIGIEALPLSFSNLWSLETLMVNNGGCPMALDPVIWDLPKLRHVECEVCFFSDSGTNEPTPLAEDSKFENLRMLGEVQLYYSKGREDSLKRFPNLKKLKCRIKELWDSSMGCNWFPQFGFLTELEELEIQGPKDMTISPNNIMSSDPGDIMSFEATCLSEFSFFPSRLKSLTLSCGFLTSDSLSTIARLSNLQYLRLDRLVILGKEWNMQDEDTFENLKSLELFWISLSVWLVGEESFPVLEDLVMWGCEELNEIPSSFGDIDSLKSIDLINSPQLQDSAFQIKQYVEDMTGDDKVHVLARVYHMSEDGTLKYENTL